LIRQEIKKIIKKPLGHATQGLFYYCIMITASYGAIIGAGTDTDLDTDAEHPKLFVTVRFV
jgi:hypothetical protein